MRHRRLKGSERPCIACGSQQLDDEYHFILQLWKSYLELRQRYIPKLYWTKPSMFKLFLISCFAVFKLEMLG